MNKRNYNYTTMNNSLINSLSYSLMYSLIYGNSLSKYKYHS